MPNKKQVVSLPEIDNSVKLDTLGASLIALFVTLEPLHDAKFAQSYTHFRDPCLAILESYKTVISRIVEVAGHVSTFHELFLDEEKGGEAPATFAQSSNDMASQISRRYLEVQVGVEDVRRRVNKVLKVLMTHSNISSQEPNNQESFVTVPIPLQISLSSTTDQTAEILSLERPTEGKSINHFLGVIYRVNDLLDRIEEDFDKLQNGWNKVNIELEAVGITGVDQAHNTEANQILSSYVKQTLTVKQLYSAFEIPEQTIRQNVQAYVATYAEGQDTDASVQDVPVNLSDMAQHVAKVLESPSLSLLLLMSRNPNNVLFRSFTRSESKSMEVAKEVLDLSSAGLALCTAQTPLDKLPKTYQTVIPLAKTTKEKCHDTLADFRVMRTQVKAIAGASNFIQGIQENDLVASIPETPSHFQDLYYSIYQLASWWTELDMQAGCLLTELRNKQTSLRLRSTVRYWTKMKDDSVNYQELPVQHGSLAYLRNHICCC